MQQGALFVQNALTLELQPSETAPIATERIEQLQLDANQLQLDTYPIATGREPVGTRTNPVATGYNLVATRTVTVATERVGCVLHTKCT